MSERPDDPLVPEAEATEPRPTTRRVGQIRIRRSTGRLEWVTKDELAVLAARRRERAERLIRLRRQRNVAAALAAVATAALVVDLVWRQPSTGSRPAAAQPSLFAFLPPQAGPGPGPTLPVVESSTVPAPAPAPPTSPVVAQPPQVTQPAVETDPVPLPAPAPRTPSLVAEPPLGRSAANLSEVRTVVLAWSAAWSDQDVSGYLGHYSPRFDDAGAAGREAWATGRRVRVERPRWIEVEITDLELSSDGDDRVLATFLQTYAAPNYQDRVVKTLALERETGGWKIVSEQTYP